MCGSGCIWKLKKSWIWILFIIWDFFSSGLAPIKWRECYTIHICNTAVSFILFTVFFMAFSANNYLTKTLYILQFLGLVNTGVFYDFQHGLHSCSVQFSSLTDWVIGGTSGAFQQRSSKSFLQQAAVSNSTKGRDVHSLMLSSQHFLCQQQWYPSSRVPWRIVLERLLWPITCLNHASFCLLTVARRGSCGPTGRWSCSTSSHWSCAPSRS